VATTLLTSDLPGLTLRHRGKVRDVFELPADKLPADAPRGRDYLETLDWDKTAPGPRLPAEVIERTRAKYAEALQRLAGISID
jgi:phosphoribosylaminoimidazole-succinocarboxamide synthase